MVVIPPGKFFMGDISGKGKNRERPVHEVSIDYALAVGKFEITRKQFAQIVRATGKSFTDGCIYFTGDKFELDHSRSWADSGYIQTDDDPAVCVSWDDAQVYLRWLNKLSTGGYRLLSEAEWEYAARAGSQSKYSFGDDIGAQCDHMNGADKSTDLKWRNKYRDDGYGRRTAPVGRYEANAFGLHNFHGNASEWVQDCEKRDYYDAPRNGAAHTGGNCSRRAVRGGSAMSASRQLRSAYRHWISRNFRFYTIGFRVARSLKDSFVFNPARAPSRR